LALLASLQSQDLMVHQFQRYRDLQKNYNRHVNRGEGVGINKQTNTHTASKQVRTELQNNFVQNLLQDRLSHTSEDKLDIFSANSTCKVCIDDVW